MRNEKGLFKKENKGKFLTLKLENEKIITNVIALKSKMNIHLCNDGESKATAKGIQKRQAKNYSHTTGTKWHFATNYLKN